LLGDGTGNAKRLLESANRITGQKFEKTAEVFQWVKLHESGGYTPLPTILYEKIPPAKGASGAP
jgi:hypothetical protein